MKILPILLCATALLSATAVALSQAPADPPETRDTVRVVGTDGTQQSVAPPALSDAERYCSAIIEPARDARAAIQSERLRGLEAQVNARIDALEAKRAEYQEWLDKREAFLQSTSTIVLDIYAGMRPDAAAAQLASLEREAAAAIIAKLKSRQASAIMSEMPAAVASELATVIVRRTDPGAVAGTPAQEVRS